MAPYFLVSVKDQYVRSRTVNVTDYEPVILGEAYDSNGDLFTNQLTCQNCNEKELLFFKYLENNGTIEISPKADKGVYIMQVRLAEEKSEAAESNEYSFLLILKEIEAPVVKEIIVDSGYNVTVVEQSLNLFDKAPPSFTLSELDNFGNLVVSFS